MGERGGRASDTDRTQNVGEQEKKKQSAAAGEEKSTKAAMVQGSTPLGGGRGRARCGASPAAGKRQRCTPVLRRQPGACRLLTGSGQRHCGRARRLQRAIAAHSPHGCSVGCCYCTAGGGGCSRLISLMITAFSSLNCSSSVTNRREERRRRMRGRGAGQVEVVSEQSLPCREAGRRGRGIPQLQLRLPLHLDYRPLRPAHKAAKGSVNCCT